MLASQSAEAKEIRVEYLDRNDFVSKARMFHVMDDLKVCSFELHVVSGRPSVVAVSQIRLSCFCYRLGYLVQLIMASSVS